MIQVYDGDGRRPYADVKVTRIPTSVADAVKLLNEIIPAEDKAAVKLAAKDRLVSFHHGFGQWIRNNFGLWTNNEALLADAAPMIPPPPPDFLLSYPDYGKDGPHPDDVSMVIIEKFWESLQ